MEIRLLTHSKSGDPALSPGSAGLNLCPWSAHILSGHFVSSWSS